MRNLLGWVGLVAVVLLTEAPALLLLPVGAQPVSGAKDALLVGVKKYDSAGFTDLSWSENDMEKLGEALAGKGVGFRSIRVMTHTSGQKKPGDRPTTVNIRAAVRELLKGRKKGDLVLIGLSGHGVQLPMPDDKEVPFFCPTNARLNDPDTLINLQQLYADLSLCGADNKILLVDACRNTVKPDLKKKAFDPNALSTPPGTAALFGCAPGKHSYESDDLEHSFFTYAVVQSLRKHRESVLTWNDLAKEVRTEVPRLAKEAGREQNPHEITNVVGEPLTLVGVPAPPRSGKRDLKITNSIGMIFRLVPRGRFSLGSPRSEAQRGDDEDFRQADFPEPFYLGIHVVTQAEYRAVMGNNPAHFSSTGKGKDKVSGGNTDRFPVESVTWAEAVAFCRNLSARAEEKKAGRTYRLPRESEWEYACRAGTTTPFHRGLSLSSRDANFDGQTFPYGGAEKGPYLGRTNAVDADRASAWGFHGMHGNVWEWCQDEYASLADGPYRVMRGGSWSSLGAGCRSANRGRWKEKEASKEIGFRVLCEMSR